MMAASLARGRLARLAAAVAVDGRQQLDIAAELEGMRDVPARIVWGLEDRIVPWTQAAAAPTRVALHLVPAAGHMPHWDQPRLVAELFGR
jgi:pyruvate dehydrogenase E2 component (dihydrolipoamide acetyltransferase)